MQSLEDVAETPGESVELAHGWLLYAVQPVTLEQAQAALAEPASAVPDTAASRLGKLRILAVPYIACGGKQEFVTSEPPEGEMHSSLWLESPGRADLFVSMLDTNEHDAGFELLAALADLLVPRLTDEEFAAYAALLERELREAVTGEIDADAFEAKQSGWPEYAATSLASTLAEYMHALWHNVEVREGEMHLPARFLRKRFELLRRIFPPTPATYCSSTG